MPFEIEKFPNGQTSLRDLEANETMHSLIGPWEEAQIIYIQQSQLKERLQLKQEYPLVIFDVGLGIAANALGAVQVFLQEGFRDLQLVSFENRPDGLEFALKNISQFPFLTPYKDLLNELLQKGEVTLSKGTGEKLHWQLKTGDFQDTISSVDHCPELIFYDFYSPKSCPELWGVQIFNLLYQATEKRRKSGLESSLITYSAATSARCAMLIAGFYVGYGVSTQGKKDTTFASTIRHSLQKPLSSEWLSHWKRSSKPVPEDFHDISTALELIRCRLE